MNCPHCGTHGSHYVEVFGDNLDKCAHCGLVYLTPAPTQAEMVRRHQSKEYAEHPYFTAGEQAAETRGLPVHEIVLSKLIALLPQGGRLLDVGAGTGDFLNYAAKHFGVDAVEASPYLADRIRKRIACQVFEGPFENYEVREPYDAVVLMDIIEHAADPRRLLRKAYDTLRPGGILAITTIDSDCLLYRMGPVVEWVSRVNRKAKYVLERIFCYQHNWYFNGEVLGDLVAQSGFQIVEHEGFEFPLNRLKESVMILAGLRVLYEMHKILGPKTEQLLIARKYNPVKGRVI